MKQTLFAAVLLAAMPVAAMAFPTIGDKLGTDIDTVKAALEKLGCPVTGIDSEDGQIEAKCTDSASNTPMEVFVDMASGQVTGLEVADPETGGETTDEKDAG